MRAILNSRFASEDSSQSLELCPVDLVRVWAGPSAFATCAAASGRERCVPLVGATNVPFVFNFTSLKLKLSLSLPFTTYL